MDLSEKLKQSGIEALENLADWCNKSAQEKAYLVRRITGQSEVDHAFEMGRSFHQDGPNGINCNYLLFTTREMTNAWERGFKDSQRGDQ